MMFTLAGKLLNYPNCCVEAFNKGEQFEIAKPSYCGFIPCKECNEKYNRDELEAIIGRDVSVEPKPFRRWVEMLRPKMSNDKFYELGIKAYSEFGEGEFFQRCWDETFPLPEIPY